MSKTEHRAVFPQYTLGERWVDGCIHAVSVTASLVALIALLIIAIKTGTALWIVALVIYGLGLVAMFGCSAGYHLTVRPKLKEVFRRLDHAAIFLMIAGTYTPFVLIKMSNPWGLTLLAVVWVIALVGIVGQLFFPRLLRKVSIALYLIQGWAVLAAWEPLHAALPGAALVLLMIGGILYTIGVVFHLWDRLPYQNAIWHGFVLSAASCHYAAVIGVVQV
ncbi:MAG: PAQR family membrane homeostasis protein TrhA [Methyloceanibacter sp.]|uniref:PAQR family membrane homeostasis protein TrhA n=1 Tax=Methyloceanibacter sp. TaxID=1965321 RepID=UPI003D6D7822